MIQTDFYTVMNSLSSIETLHQSRKLLIIYCDMLTLDILEGNLTRHLNREHVNSFLLTMTGFYNVSCSAFQVLFNINTC